MSAVKGKDTSPEVRVRKVLHANGYRFRLHRKDLPGKPDIVLPKHNTCIFVHGCFWHQHPGCKRATLPTTRREFWTKKFQANKKRDSQTKEQLEKLGWHVCVIWECKTKSSETLISELKACFSHVSD
ncbi:MAG: very short patch repair endonuclease [Candidatus Thiodiazotropha taylori]|uniref:Very short patch repair endonuclease n=1 Tax=Candidatus Thiodiazotropha taylori TaxID=2792791 RepID=A0A9E4NLL1_9GAMM|nr:very short patch repair endonuclease [Candidatus Thiodiazotropha taylori]